MMIEAKIIAHSRSSIDGSEIVTFELTYPRFIHSELLTHRVFSRNAASSRAIPVDRVIEQVEAAPASPEAWGINQPGMQAEKELKEKYKIATAKYVWLEAAKRAAHSAKELKELGLHKQIVNRVLEPFVHMRTVITTTELDNFFWLRCHKDAQPEFRLLAEAMSEQLDASKPTVLSIGHWHVPYYEGNYGNGIWKPSGYGKFLADGNAIETDHKRGYTLQEALKISASCCAQVSYRKNDKSVEKADKIYDKLISSDRLHASPFEHQATPMRPNAGHGDVNDSGDVDTWEPGITHVNKEGEFWSGNFKGWRQHRQLISIET